jgi:hypothetical protein
MSGVAVIRHLLANAAPVTAIAPAARTFGGVIPQGTAAPAIGVHQISLRSFVVLSGAARLHTERVQVTVHALTYAQQRALVAAARAACPCQAGTVNGVDLDSILPGGEGPDGFDGPDPGIYQQTIDFIVKWRGA